MSKNAKVIKMEPKKDTVAEFIKWKDVELFKLQAAAKQARRVDTWVSLREDYRNFIGSIPSKEDVDKLWQKEIEFVDNICDVLENFFYEDLIVDEFEDPYHGYVAVEDAGETEFDIFVSFLKFSTTRSWAEHLFSIREVIMNELSNQSAATE